MSPRHLHAVGQSHIHIGGAAWARYWQTREAYDRAAELTLAACDATEAAAVSVFACPWWRPFELLRRRTKLRRVRAVMRARKAASDRLYRATLDAGGQL